MSALLRPVRANEVDELLKRLEDLPSEDLSNAIGEANSYLASDAGRREFGDRRALKAKFDRV